MDAEKRKHMLSVVTQTVSALHAQDIITLRALSDETIHGASAEQSRSSLLLAVIVYSLSKILERPRYKSFKGWKSFAVGCNKCLEDMQKALEKGNEQEFEDAADHYLESITSLDQRLQKYVHDVVEQAKISKASRIYEHGISAGKTASIAGVSIFDVQEYVGKNTYIADMKENLTIPVKIRLQAARKLFK